MEPLPSTESGEASIGAAISTRQAFLLGRRIDVNRAGADALDGLPGISRGTAEAIVAERERRGAPFLRPSDLLRVRGIKEKRLRKILPFLAPFTDNN